MINNSHRKYIKQLRKEYEVIKHGKDSLLTMIAEVELPELVYNSNAIENSTLTLKETEKILLELEVARQVSVRELFEAKNLARVTEYIRQKKHLNINQENVLLLHRMLIGGINDKIAGRLRESDEHVRVGAFIAPPPEHIERLLKELFAEYHSSEEHPADKISRFHLEFERIHPFVDGNGRIGRVLINLQLMSFGYPPIIIRNKGKRNQYYPAFSEYQGSRATKKFDSLLALALTESLHKRITHLKGDEIIRLTEYAEQNRKSINTLLNASRRQTIPAFRERGTWKISKTTEV